MELKIPSRVFIREKDIPDFNMLKNEKDSPFYNQSARVIFLMAMIIGFHKNQRLKLESKKEFVRMEYFSSDDKSLMKAIAIHCSKDGLRILLDPQEIYSIAEEYAAGGISYLKKSVFDNKFGSYVKKLESELNEIFGKLRIDN